MVDSSRETTPFPRNGDAVQPILQLNSSIAPILSIGENLEVTGQVSLEIGANSPYEHPKMKPLYVFYTIMDQNAVMKETKVILHEPNPGSLETFNASIPIESTLAANQTYALEIWAMTKRGGVSVLKHEFEVFAAAEIELEAELDGGSNYTENEWTTDNVIVSATFSNDIPSKRQYAVTGPTVSSPASVNGWQSYVEPIELEVSGEYIVWV